MRCGASSLWVPINVILNHLTIYVVYSLVEYKIVRSSPSNTTVAILLTFFLVFEQLESVPGIEYGQEASGRGGATVHAIVS